MEKPEAPEFAAPPTSKKPLLRALRGESLAPPPIWLMRQAGRYLPEYRELRRASENFLEFCFSPDRAADATLQPVRRFGMDAAILFSDILVVPYALGRQVSFREGEGPVLEPLRRREEVSSLDQDAVLERLAPVYNAIRLVKPALPGSVALIGFAGAPWTVATYMVEGGSSRDFTAVKRWAFGDPEGFTELIDRLAEATIEHLSAQISAGVEAVQLFDSWAGVLPEHEFRRFVIAPTQRIVAALAARHPGLPIIGFPRGAGLLYRAYVTETKIGAVSLDQSVPCDIAHKTLQSLAPVQGNLDPLLLVLGGAPLAAAAARICAAFAGGPFIFNLGHGVLPETPVKHVAELIELVRRVS
jgi:uroporphyrinogen decarboxylase